MIEWDWWLHYVPRWKEVQVMRLAILYGSLQLWGPRHWGDDQQWQEDKANTQHCAVSILETQEGKRGCSLSCERFRVRLVGMRVGPPLYSAALRITSLWGRQFSGNMKVRLTIPTTGQITRWDIGTECSRDITACPLVLPYTLYYKRLRIDG